jgi:hypothetical protein
MLPEGFEFSQGSLQDYVDCPRRFQLRYIHAQPWPAVEAEPAVEREEHTLRGQQFHRLMERYYSGLPEEMLTFSLENDQIRQWWQAFQTDPPLNLPRSVVRPESRLATPVAGKRLVAVFDLLAIEPGRRLVIVDWKTGRYRPTRESMADRLQTRVYPFVAVEAAQYLFGDSIDPARVTLCYWFANEPQSPLVFHHDAVHHEETRGYLEHLIEDVVERVARSASALWDLAADDSRCKYCVYRSLCGRGVEAGVADEFLDDEGDGLYGLDVVELVEY